MASRGAAGARLAAAAAASTGLGLIGLALGLAALASAAHLVGAEAEAERQRAGVEGGGEDLVRLDQLALTVRRREARVRCALGAAAA